jgi:hypothetical protein
MNDATAHVATGQAAALSPLEKAALKDCERIIEKGLKAFYEVGLSLAQIRNCRLYRATHKTFTEYCRDRWGFTDSRARQLIAGAKVADAVQTVTNVTVPNESIARELNRLPDNQQAGAWTDTLDRCGGVDNATAAEIKKTVDLWSADNDPYVPDGDDHGDRGEEDLGHGHDDPTDQNAEDIDLRPLSERYESFREIPGNEDKVRAFCRDNPTTWLLSMLGSTHVAWLTADKNLTVRQLQIRKDGVDELYHLSRSLREIVNRFLDKVDEAVQEKLVKINEDAA